MFAVPSSPQHSRLSTRDFASPASRCQASKSQELIEFLRLASASFRALSVLHSCRLPVFRHERIASDSDFYGREFGSFLKEDEVMLEKHGTELIVGCGPVSEGFTVEEIVRAFMELVGSPEEPAEDELVKNLILR